MFASLILYRYITTIFFSLIKTEFIEVKSFYNPFKHKSTHEHINIEHTNVSYMKQHLLKEKYNSQQSRFRAIHKHETMLPKLIFWLALIVHSLHTFQDALTILLKMRYPIPLLRCLLILRLIFCDIRNMVWDII